MQNWRDLYQTLNQASSVAYPIPVIGIVGDFDNISLQISKAGGTPVWLKNELEPSAFPSLLESIGALMLTNAEANITKVLLQSALDRQMPILAIGNAHDALRKMYGNNLMVTRDISEVPYKSVKGTEEASPEILTWLINEAKEFTNARNLHQRILSLDTHCDTPMFFDQGIQFGQRDSHILVDAHKMREGHLDASIMAAYLEQQGRSDEELKAATEKCNRLLHGIEERIASCEGVGLARTPQDLYRLKQEGKLAIMKGIENGYAIGKDISNVERYRREGVVYMTLCHNGDNDICDAAVRTQHEHNGLSRFGFEVVEEMNRVGMMVDLSHGGEKSFYDALEASKTPIVCSHASTRALCDHPRNLTDEQLRALSRKGGVMQVTMYPGFLRLDSQASIEDAVNHLKHAVDVAGIDCVGIGTDFDGDGGIPGMADASEVINFTRRLLRERFSEKDIAKIWGENFLRVMRQVQDFGCIKF